MVVISHKVSNRSLETHFTTGPQEIQHKRARLCGFNLGAREKQREKQLDSRQCMRFTCLSYDQLFTVSAAPEARHPQERAVVHGRRCTSGPVSATRPEEQVNGKRPQTGSR